ncbi:hypothetical protein COJ85_32070 [Bacillus sp. AFS076308]|uniref:hypothetical protein n=1 Tax=unclassified Bacillus (in: firmicutes) TaxID=185979 RepID=UPI000BF49F3F|nr:MULTISPECIES: hypothetical protein [unclassified Bacillus (in: firmicutes)]PFN77607.1 hypothetical protein COJ85_32070 [Bacillus sp. AFS076308]PGV45312.1 hypothetical protein COD92_30850 [Bacillus sp. AFS037270]
MELEQIKELLQYDVMESKIFIPNEIFDDLKGANIKNNPHLTFSYSYIYFATWIYRYAKHLNCTEGFIDNEKMKEILRYNPTNKDLVYLIKKNGLLEQLGYTKTVKDFPTSWTYDEIEGIEFDMYSEHKEDLRHLNLSRKFSVKLPVKAFHRYEPDELDGTFYEVANTHCIPFEVFMYCMAKNEIGSTGFYLYSYIKRMNDMYPKGWDVALHKMSKETAIPESTLDEYIGVLRKYRMINVQHNQELFSLAMRIEDRKANTYKANKFDQFSITPQPYEKIKVLKTSEYKKVKGEENIQIWGKKADITLDELPF